jgi:hypothetical protein
MGWTTPSLYSLRSLSLSFRSLAFRSLAFRSLAFRSLASLALLSLGPVFLGAAAAPPGECAPGADDAEVSPAPLDLAGRPGVPDGLTGQTFASLPGPEGGNDCHSPLWSVSQATTLRGRSGDVLHGLPEPESLRPIDEPRQAPEFQ